MKNEIPLLTTLYAVNTWNNLVELYRQRAVFIPIEPADILSALSVQTVEIAEDALKLALENGYIDDETQLTVEGIKVFAQ